MEAEGPSAFGALSPVVYTGTSLIALMVASSALGYSARQSDGGFGDDIDDGEGVGDRATDCFALRSALVSGVRRTCLDCKDESDDGGLLVARRGSCYCQAVQFTALVPRQYAKARETGPGSKIRFPHTPVRASNFRVDAGRESLKTYRVVLPDGKGNNDRKEAHAFCKHCGVHVLHAPSEAAPYLNINVRCIQGDDDNDARSNAEGIPAKGQFGNFINSDQSSTASEVSRLLHFYANNEPQSRRCSQSDDASSIDSFSIRYSEDGCVVEVPASWQLDADRQQQPTSPPAASTAATASLTTAEEAVGSSASSYSSLHSTSRVPDLRTAAPTSRPLSPPPGGANLGGVDDFGFVDVSQAEDEDSSGTAYYCRRPLAAGSKQWSSPIMPGRGMAGSPLSSSRNPKSTCSEMRETVRRFMGKYNDEKQSTESQ